MNTLFAFLAIVITTSIFVIACIQVANKLGPVFSRGERIAGTLLDTRTSNAIETDPIQDQLTALADRLDHLTELLVAVLDMAKIEEQAEQAAVASPPVSSAPKAAKGAGQAIRRRPAPAPARVGNGRRKITAPTEGAPA